MHRTPFCLVFLFPLSLFIDLGLFGWICASEASKKTLLSRWSRVVAVCVARFRNRPCMSIVFVTSHAFTHCIVFLYLLLDCSTLNRALFLLYHDQSMRGSLIFANRDMCELFSISPILRTESSGNAAGPFIEVSITLRGASVSAVVLP